MTPGRSRRDAGPYKRSKFLAEQVALEFAAEGFPVVIVNPTAPVGDHDFKPTPTGKIVVDFVRGAMPAYLDTGLNVVDVRDVARRACGGAANAGAPGERYILGAENLTLEQIFGEAGGDRRAKAAAACGFPMRWRMRRGGVDGLGRHHRQGAAGAAGRRADGAQEDVGAARQGRARIGICARSGGGGAAARGRVVSGERVLLRHGVTWLVVAAERREFAGILKRCGHVRAAGLAGAEFAREAEWKGDRWLLIANGPGRAWCSRR